MGEFEYDYNHRASRWVLNDTMIPYIYIYMIPMLSHAGRLVFSLPFLMTWLRVDMCQQQAQKAAETPNATVSCTSPTDAHVSGLSPL